MASIEELNLGMINYWNLHPLASELARVSYSNLNVYDGHPTSINRLLGEGKIHLAPCSSVCLATSQGHEMVLPMGVASDGPVRSVYIGLQQEHGVLLEWIRERRGVMRKLFSEARKTFGLDARKLASFIWNEVKGLPNLPISQCPSIVFTNSSATSSALSRLLYLLWFGHESYKLMATRGFSRVYEEEKPLQLLIGDEALLKRNRFYRILDLGAVWKEMTGLPFVFAVWQSKGACLNGWRRKILDIGEKAEAQMKTDPSIYYPSNLPLDEVGRPIPLAEYWKVIQYRLGTEHIKGLLIFLCLTRKVMSMPLDNSLMCKIMRWQEMCHQGSVPTI